MTDAPAEGGGSRLSVCLFCGSSTTADPDLLSAASRFGALLAGEGVRLVYGGGGVGLMGAAARAAHGAGGEVLGVIPRFLCRAEVVYADVETRIVETMHERKRAMFDEADAFAVLPGGIGTLEEAVELISWRRLGLHEKPIVFLDHQGFWAPFFDLLQHTVEARLTPPWAVDICLRVARIEELLPAIRANMASVTAPPRTALQL